MRPTLKQLFAIQLCEIGIVQRDLRQLADCYPDDPNYGRIREALDYLEAAAGRLKCAV